MTSFGRELNEHLLSGLVQVYEFIFFNSFSMRQMSSDSGIVTPDEDILNPKDRLRHYLALLTSSKCKNALNTVKIGLLFIATCICSVRMG